MATVAACWSALRRLAASLDEVDPQLRQRYVPERVVGCRVTDLDVCFTARIGPDGLTELTRAGEDEVTGCEVRAALTSDELVALAEGTDTLLAAWVHGRIQINAPIRDVLRLRALVGM